MRSSRQFDRDGPLLDQAGRALADETIWDCPWAPEDCDFGAAFEHPVWQERFTREQRLAWNHLHWALDYFTVGQGERQVLRLNVHAVRGMADVLPNVVELEERESDEERDHIACFVQMTAAVWSRYLPGQSPPPVPATSGLASRHLGEQLQDVMGPIARRLLGGDFPTLFFLARGMKSHGFKPFEVEMARFGESHPAIRRISGMHGQDESRHIATAHHLARMAQSLTAHTSLQSRRLFSLALRAAFPRNRLDRSRFVYWRHVLDHAPVFASIPAAERDALFEHVTVRHADRLGRVAERFDMIRKSNRNIVDHADLPDERRSYFIEYMKSEPAYAALVADAAAHSVPVAAG